MPGISDWLLRMILLGYCSLCQTPVWAMHKDAGAIEKECKHPVEAIAWLRRTPQDKEDRA